MRLPTSWELCRPVGAPDSGYVLSATLLSGPSPIRAALSRRVPLRRRRYGSPSSGRLVGSELLFFLGRHQVDTRSQFMGAPVPAELPAQPPCRRRPGPRGGRLDPLLCVQSPGVTRATEGQKFAGRTGPDVRRSLSKRSGRRCCAETGRRVPTGRAATRGWGSLSSLGLPSGLRTVATVHAVREFDCLDASSLRPCFSNAAHARAGKGRFDARPGNCKSVPVRGWMSPTSQRLFQLRPHAVTSRRDRAANVRAGVPSAGDGRPGRPTIG